MTAIDFCKAIREILWQWEHRLISREQLRAGLARVNLQFTDGVEQGELWPEASPTGGLSS